MRLDLGGQETIDDPTPEQVSHYLRFMPAQSPFIVLEHSEGHFIQATIEDDRYRVDHCEGGSHRYVKADYAKADAMFFAFLNGDTDIREKESWERLYLLLSLIHI